MVFGGSSPEFKNISMSVANKIKKVPRWLQVTIVILIILLAAVLVLKYGGWFDKVAAVYVARGDGALTEGNYSQALQQYNYAISLEHLDGNSAYVAYLKRGRIMLSKRNYAQAAAELERAVKLRKKKPEAYLLLGQAYMGQAQFADAVGSLAEAFKYNEDNPEIMIELAKAILRQGDELGRAEDLLRQAISLDPEAQPAHLYLALLLLERDIAEALEEISTTLDLSGEVTVSAQSVHERILDLKKRMSSRGDDNESQAYRLVLVGWTYANVNEYAPAKRLAEEALVISPEYRDAWELLAWSQIGLEDYAGAINSLTEAYNLDPTSGQTQYLFARAEAGSGQIDAALESYEKALLLGFDHRSLRLDYARLLIKKGDNDSAAEQLQMAYEMNKQDLVVAQELIWFLGKIKNESDEALRIAKAVNRFSDSPLAKSMLALAYYFQDDSEQALRITEEVIFQEPGQALAYYVRGLVTGNGNDFVKAIDVDFEGTVGSWAYKEIN